MIVKQKISEVRKEVKRKIHSDDDERTEREQANEERKIEREGSGSSDVSVNLVDQEKENYVYEPTDGAEGGVKRICVKGKQA